jgi:hypothetical protein
MMCTMHIVHEGLYTVGVARPVGLQAPAG